MSVMDINEILHYLPHRYPFLLIDRIVERRDLRETLAALLALHNGDGCPKTYARGLFEHGVSEKD